METAGPVAGPFLSVADQGVGAGEVVPGAAEGDGARAGGEVEEEGEEGWGGHGLGGC